MKLPTLHRNEMAMRSRIAPTPTALIRFEACCDRRGRIALL